MLHTQSNWTHTQHPNHPPQFPYFLHIHSKPSSPYLNTILSFLYKLLSKPYIILASYVFINILSQIPHPYHFLTQNPSLTSLLLRCGDIEPNPRPCHPLIANLPPNYNTCSSCYFLPKTIKLKPEYQHIAQIFAPNLLTTHPTHTQKTLSHPHLYHFIQTHNSHPSPQILYILILAMSPSPDICNSKLQSFPNPPFAQKNTHSLVPITCTT